LKRVVRGMVRDYGSVEEVKASNDWELKEARMRMIGGE